MKSRKDTPYRRQAKTDLLSREPPTWDQVDEASLESFPASDPPGSKWIVGPPSESPRDLDRGTMALRVKQ